jgi:hypothetical protein
MPIHLKELIVKAFVRSKAENEDDVESNAPCDCEEPKESTGASGKMFEELSKMMNDKKDR